MIDCIYLQSRDHLGVVSFALVEQTWDCPVPLSIAIQLGSIKLAASLFQSLIL